MSERRISLRLESEEDVAWLKAHGGVSKAIRSALANSRRGEQQENQLHLLRQIAQKQEQIIARLDALQAEFSRQRENG